MGGGDGELVTKVRDTRINENREVARQERDKER